MADVRILEERVDGLTHNYRISLAARSVAEAVDGELKRIGPTVRVPGFRRGRVPPSLYWANFAAHEPWYHDLEDLAHYCRQYQRLMTHWRGVIPRPLIELVYEDLVRDLEARIADLLHSIGLELDPACVRFYEHDRPIMTASHAQVRRPMNARGIDHWRRYAEWIGPLLDLDDD